jgi:predicted dehydrogenase
LAFTKAELAGIAAAASNRKLQVGVGCNHLETMSQLREAISELGTVFSAYHDGFFGTSSRRPWFWDFAQSGGIWMLWGIDQIASLVYLLGRAKSVTSKRTATFDRDDLSESVSAIIEFATGAVGVIQTTIHAPGYFMSLRIVGSEGSIDCLHSAGGAPFFHRRKGSKDQHEIPIVHRGKRLDVDSWLDSLATGQNHVMSLEDIVHWHDVAFACQESQATGRTIDLTGSREGQ